MHIPAREGDPAVEGGYGEGQGLAENPGEGEGQKGHLGQGQGQGKGLAGRSWRESLVVEESLVRRIQEMDEGLVASIGEVEG